LNKKENIQSGFDEFVFKIINFYNKFHWPGKRNKRWNNKERLNYIDLRIKPEGCPFVRSLSCFPSCLECMQTYTCLPTTWYAANCVIISQRLSLHGLLPPTERILTCRAAAFIPRSTRPKKSIQLFFRHLQKQHVILIKSRLNLVLKNARFNSSPLCTVIVDSTIIMLFVISHLKCLPIQLIKMLIAKLHDL